MGLITFRVVVLLAFGDCGVVRPISLGFFIVVFDGVVLFCYCVLWFVLFIVGTLWFVLFIVGAVFVVLVLLVSWFVACARCLFRFGLGFSII